MIKDGIDRDALITMFAEASAKQGEALRKAVSSATLKALQGRELTLESIKKVVKTVADAASIGAAKNPASAIDVEAMLGKALAGIDAALLQAVEANRKALEQFVSHGVGLSEKPMKEALANLEKMEDAFFAAVAKASKGAGSLQAPWEQALAAFKMKGSETGSQATQTVESLMAQAQTTLRDTRASSMRAAQAMLDSYTALVSGVLIGMSEGLKAGATPAMSSPTASAAATPAAPAATRRTRR
jgi:predicted transcriptional regulator